MSQFRNLVFEGGGVKGIAYAGAVKVLDKDEKILDGIQRVGGTSAGAITACLVALGARGDDIQDIVGHTSFRKFMDDSWGVLRDTRRLLDEYGWYKGDSFAEWIRKVIYEFAGNPDLTFRELHQRAQAPKSRMRELYVVGTNLSAQLEQLYAAEYTPDVPVWLAVRVSMSIPLFFAAVQHERAILVDGGVTWNYPLDLFDDRRFVTNAKAAVKPSYTRYDDDHVFNKETLGLRVDTKDEIRAEKEGWRRPPKEIENILDYSKVLVGFMMDTANKAHLHQNDWHRTIFIDAGGVRSTQFDLSDEKVTMLVKNGEEGARTYFKWFNDPKQKPMNRV
jgi:NTE family protein